MQRTAILLVYFFICVNCFSQLTESGGQYPFVHYTPKDGLVNSRVRKAYQDSKGRMYFLTFGGLSVYDGARFKNYTIQDGLGANLVNDILEVGDDSLLVATNSGYYLNVLVKGKISKLNTGSAITPVANQFYRHDNGKIYLSSDNGLFILENKNVRELNTSDLKDKFLGTITGFGEWLLFTTGEMNPKQGLYLYDIKNNRISDSLVKHSFLIGKDEHNRIWASFSGQLLIMDTIALSKGKLSFIGPADYDQAKNYSVAKATVGENCIWFLNRNKEFRNAEMCFFQQHGSILKMTLPEKAMSSSIENIFIDKENTIWLSSDGEGVFKIVNSPLQVFENLSGSPGNGFIDEAYYSGNSTWYSTSTNKFFKKTEKGLEEFNCNMMSAPDIFHDYGKKLVAHDYNNIYEGEVNKQKKSIRFRKIISLPDTDFLGKKLLVDTNNNIIAIRQTGLAVWKNNEQIFFVPTRKPDIIDALHFDNNNLLWVIKRYSGIEGFSLHPESTSGYLQTVFQIPKEQIIGSPRSFVIDKSGEIWIGTRDNGVICYRRDDQRLNQLYHFHSGNGLADNFVTALACDSFNNIIVGTQTGLDRILREGENSFRIENLSKGSNFFAQINQCWADKKQAYARSISGAILQLSFFPGEKRRGPELLLEEIRVNGQPIIKEKKRFSWKENNMSFLVAAPSFIDEKQVIYSYLVEGSGNKQWSDTSAVNAVINLTNLSAGNYVLKVKAFFPSASYSPAEFSYHFEITPPWWQTRVFRLAAALLIIGLLLVAARFYYRRKLEKQMAALEKQQMIEKERTRIATDMHDDLGAGLSRIKFLSQSILNKKIKDEVIKTELEKITSFSDEMSEKMGEIVWALNERNDTLADLIAYTRSYAVEYLANHDIECDANTPLHLPDTFITGEMRRNVFLSVKECLHNIVKHAEATKVFFSVQLNGTMEIIIHDNGKGIDWDNRRAFSNGLENVNRRMKEVNGTVNFSYDQGTKVSLTIPLIL
jgi:signal transduction histidine kinase